MIVYLFKDFSFLIHRNYHCYVLLDVNYGLNNYSYRHEIILVSYVFMKYDRDAYRRLDLDLQK